MLLLLRFCGGRGVLLRLHGRMLLRRCVLLWLRSSVLLRCSDNGALCRFRGASGRLGRLHRSESRRMIVRRERLGYGDLTRAAVVDAVQVATILLRDRDVRGLRRGHRIRALVFDRNLRR